MRVALVGNSEQLHAVLAIIPKVAAYEVPVLIEGETGTGKELAAREIHYCGPRRARPFVPVNCGAIPESLIENELFGHRRGAFTDARDDQPGLIAIADCGTLFLDEVDSLPAKGQVALLRFLQDQQYRPLGERHDSVGNVRILAATNRDLAALCRAGTFRIDLLYRLQFFRLLLPPLRERRGDTTMLAHHFLASAAARFQKRARPIAAETLAWFERYDWPGNVRELENMVCREFLLCEEEVLRIRPPDEELSGDDGLLSYREAKSRAIETFERRYLSHAMKRAAGNVTAAARLIGTERRHLARLLRKFGVARV
jgi:DNA-binding NtrC family response regulator